MRNEEALSVPSGIWLLLWGDGSESVAAVGRDPAGAARYAQQLLATNPVDHVRFSVWGAAAGLTLWFRKAADAGPLALVGPDKWYLNTKLTGSNAGDALHLVGPFATRAELSRALPDLIADRQRVPLWPSPQT